MSNIDTTPEITETILQLLKEIEYLKGQIQILTENNLEANRRLKLTHKYLHIAEDK